MKKADYNIEFAHIYSNQPKLTEEQIKSSEQTKKIIEKIKDEGKSYVVTLLVDEYHPKFHQLNFNKFLNNLSSLGVKPTYIGYESKMISAARLLLKTIPPDFKDTSKFHPKLRIKEDITYLKDGDNKIKLKTRGDIIHFSRYTCAILSAAWVLLRMGVLQAKNAVELTGLTKPKPFAGKEVINVLPKKYKGVEEANRQIIESSSEYKGFEKKIHSEYFEVSE